MVSIMVIITWKQARDARSPETPYQMRIVVKPVIKPGQQPFVVEREHTDAAGVGCWIPAAHEQATTLLCRGVLQLALGGPSVTVSNSVAVVDLGWANERPGME